MSFDYYSFNPSQYLSNLTKTEWKSSEGGSNSDLQLETVDLKAKEILGILQENGISAQLSGSEGITRIIVPKESLDKLREAHISANGESKLEVDFLAQSVRKHSDLISEWKEKSISELMQCDVIKLKELINISH